MDTEMKSRLEEAGVNLASAMQRFMNNEKMVEKYLNRFLTEKSYQELVDALNGNDVEVAARAAHTLKSVCGTLGFEKMQQQVINMESDIKNNNWNAAVAMLPELESEYERLCAAIKG